LLPDYTTAKTHYYQISGREEEVGRGRDERKREREEREIGERV